jgi:hypothetical protein
MTPELSCIEDTIRFLLDEAKEARATAREKCGSPEEAFAVGRAEALTEVLHTWSNQLQTFCVAPKLNGTWEILRSFLDSQGC